MAKLTTRDRVWNAALEYAGEWDDTDFSQLENRRGFTVKELIDMKNLDASHKTVNDTLSSMTELGWLKRTGRYGGTYQYFR